MSGVHPGSMFDKTLNILFKFILYQVDQVRAMSVVQRNRLTIFIQYAHLFRVTLQGDNTDNTLLDSSHPLILAFKLGLFQPSFETRLDLKNVSNFGF